MRAVFGRGAASEQTPWPPTLETGDAEMEWREVREFIEHGLEHWTPLQKSVTRLLLEGYTPQQIATLNGCSRRTAERIRKQLMAMLTDLLQAD